MHEPHNGGQAALQPHSVLGHFALRVPEKCINLFNGKYTQGAGVSDLESLIPAQAFLDEYRNKENPSLTRPSPPCRSPPLPSMFCFYQIPRPRHFGWGDNSHFWDFRPTILGWGSFSWPFSFSSVVYLVFSLTSLLLFLLRKR